MPPTDNPLKILIDTFRQAFAEWLLGEPVQEIRPLNVELPASTSRADLFFEVVQVDGQVVLLHIEQQGRSSQIPMPWRMLEYITRLTLRELGRQALDASIRLHSVVLYTGVGAGATDQGRYEILGLDGTPQLSWRYEPILLWQMEAETLLRLEQPAFLPLVGQTRLTEPERVLPIVLKRIRQVADEHERGRLLTALAGLMRNEEALAMVERMLDEAEDELLDTPYLRRIRQQGRAEGLLEGREAGVVEGLREAILEVIAVRFNPGALEYRRVGQQLTTLDRREPLQHLLAVAAQAEEMAAFTARLDEELGQGQ